MLIWIKWLEKRAIRIEIRWEETNPEIGERERERDNLVEKCQRERILWKVGSTNIRIVESTAVHMRRTDSTHIFLSFFWHVMPTRPSDTAVPRFFFFFLFNYLPQKLFAHFKKGLQRCNFSVQESRNIYLLFCCIYLQEFFLSFMLFFWPFICIYLLLFF